jgi:hypothetical protein
VKSIDGTWHSNSAGYLVFNTRDGYVISAFPHDEDVSKYLSCVAWLRELEEYVIEIKMCNLARSCEWQRMYYRILGESLHWNNGRRDFHLEKISESEVCEKAVLAIERATSKFMNIYSSDTSK